MRRSNSEIEFWADHQTAKLSDDFLGLLRKAGNLIIHPDEWGRASLLICKEGFVLPLDGRDDVNPLTG